MGRFYQYYSTLCANLLSLGVGLALGWSSPVLPLLQSNETPLPSGPLTNDEATTITSLLLMGNLFGTIIFGLIADKFGRKIAMYFVATPYILCWILMLAAQNVYYLFIARFLSGLTAGGSYLVIPMYVTEIAEINIRGKLGSFLQLHCNIGILLQYIVGSYFNYYVICSLPLILPVAFMIGFSFLPETPAYLVLRHRFNEAEKSLKFYRGCSKADAKISDSVNDELDKMKMKLSETEFKYSDLTISDFTNRSAWKGIMLSSLLLVTLTCSGTFTIVNYSAFLFKETGSTFSPNTSSIIVAIISLAGSCISPFVVERAGRRPILLLSCCTSGICFAIMGIYCYLRNNEYEVSDYSWISIVGLSGAVFNSSWGMLSLGAPIVTEILSIKIRAIIAVFSRIQMCIFGFILLKFLFDMIDWIGIDGCMWFFAIYSVIYFMIIAIFLPETKGRSIDDIVKSLDKK